MDIQSLRNDVAQGKKYNYLFFWGHTVSKDGKMTKTCFSQWFPAVFTVDAIQYKTAEHYMMAEKARLFGDDEIREEIIDAVEPKKAKALGRKVSGFDDKIWKEKSYEIVVKGNEAKFSQNEALKEFLLATGDDVIVEASPYDRIWGIGMTAEHPDIQNPCKWRGANLLGLALMDVREQIRANFNS